MAKEGHARAGLDNIQTDHQGFPSYRFVLDRKPPRELSESAQVEHMAKQIEKLVEQGEDIFLKALKKVRSSDRMDLPISFKRKKRSVPDDADF